MNKFKVGDDVVLVDSGGYSSVGIGDTGKIVAASYGWYIIRMNKYTFNFELSFLEYEIELKDKYDTLLWRELDE